MNADALRLFIALPLPEQATTALEETGRELARLLPAGSVRWVPATRMHLTLVFLGETAATRLPDLQNVVDRVAAAGQPQRSALGPLGCFPNARRPHVFWASLDQNPAPLQALHNALADNLIPLGWVRDARPFSPHITLGRVRRGARVVFPDLPPQPPPLTMEIDRIQLLSSRRGASGPHYRVLHTARLGHAT